MSELLPRHIALIMDGNTRWAQQKKLAVSEGHKQGVETLLSIVKKCVKEGISYLTVFAFSSENWKRSDEEVSNIMSLFVDSLDRESGRLMENNVALRFIGDRYRFDKGMQELMLEAEARVPQNTKLTLILAMDYGGRRDITNACRKIGKNLLDGKYSLDEITESLVSSELALSNIPEPDMCIRTGNEHRISNFLLWNLAYTELYFPPILWPDFEVKHLDEALEDFSYRKRRYGTSSMSSYE